MTRTIAILTILGLATTVLALPVRWEPVVNTPYGPGIPVDMSAGGGAVVQLVSAGAGTVGGMDLFITVPDVVQLSEGTTIGLPAGVYNTTNTAGENVDFSDVSGGFRHGQMYTFANQTIQVTAGMVLAQFKFTLPPGSPLGTKFWMENTWDGTPSSIGGSDMPVVGAYLIVPEPSVALLVLAGLALGCRRTGRPA